MQLPQGWDKLTLIWLKRWSMDIQFFQTFLKVAKLGNMTQAAEQLNFTQPTITGQIRSLEQHFGVMLFERIGKKLYITDAGRELIVYAERILTAFNEGEKALSALPEKINLGVGTAIVNYILFPYLQAFQQQAPKCSVAIEMCHTSPMVIKGILENRFDLGFIQNEVTVDYLIGFEVFKEELVWIAHPKLMEKLNNSNNMSDYPLLVYKEGGLFRSLYENTLGRKRFEPTIEYNDSEAMKNAILQGLGCGALPMTMIKNLLKDGTLIEFTNIDRPAFTVWVVFHRDKMLSPAAMNLIKILQRGNSITMK